MLYPEVNRREVARANLGLAVIIWSPSLRHVQVHRPASLTSYLSNLEHQKTATRPEPRSLALTSERSDVNIGG